MKNVTKKELKAWIDRITSIYGNQIQNLIGQGMAPEDAFLSAVAYEQKKLKELKDGETEWAKKTRQAMADGIYDHLQREKQKRINSN